MVNRVISDNLAELYRQAAQRYGELPAFATRHSALKWEPVSFGQLYEQGLNIAAGLIEIGIQAQEHVGLFSDNRVEWILADCGVQLCGAVDVPRGCDTTDAEFVYIVNHAGIRTAFVETEELAERFLALRDKFPCLRDVILLAPKEKAPPGVRKFHEICSMGERLRAGGDKRTEARVASIRPEDLFTLIYTSGTTGNPKGVMLTHANIISQIRNLPGKRSCTDRALSILPVWHVFERIMEMYTISCGTCTYYSGIRTLAEDMKNIEPTFMASAPRLWEKLHERILKAVRSSHPVRRALFHTAYVLARWQKESVFYLKGTNLKLHPCSFWQHFALSIFHGLRWLLVLPWYGFFNAAVLERVRQVLGSSLNTTISGGGALPVEIDRFFNYLGIQVLEGYGLTETSPVLAVRSIENLVIGTVGPPLPETEIRIVAPETEEIFFPNEKYPGEGRGMKGEIWARGPQVMKGYYRQEALTEETIKNGWLRTGDLGIITFNDCLKIMGRCKATIVLSSGENVEPEPIEMRLQQSPYIDYCMLVGQDRKFLCALIVPDLEELRSAGIQAESLKELACHRDAHRIIKEEIRRIISPACGFKRHEQIRDFRLLPDTFKPGHELTNIFKIKRHVIEEQYGEIIREMFSL